MAAPTFQAAGTAVEGTTSNVNISWPAHAANDIAVLVMEYSGSLPEPVGWNYLYNMSTASTHNLVTFWKRATSSAMDDTTIEPAGNDHFVAQILTFRGCTPVGVPFNIDIGSGVKSVASTSVSSAAGITTVVADELLVFFCGRDNDSASAAFSGWANASLTSVTERTDVGTALGNGGGFGVATGVKAAIGGSTGTWTATVTSSANTYLTLSLQPEKRKRYWVGNGGSMADSAHWALTSGGAGGAGVPPDYDTLVYFDANSFSLPGQTVTMDGYTSLERVDWTGVTNSPTWDLTNDELDVWGSLIVADDVTIINQEGGTYLYGQLPEEEIRCGGNNIGYVSFLGTKPFLGNSSYYLSDPFIGFGISHQPGDTGDGFYSNNFDITVTSDFWVSNYANTPVELGTSTITAATIDLDLGNDAGGSVNASLADFITVPADNGGYIFATAAQEMNSLTIGSDIELYPYNFTVGELTVDPGVTVVVYPSGTNKYVYVTGDVNMVGDSSNLIRIKSYPALLDNFDDNFTSASKWPNRYNTSATYAETTKQLVITLAGSTAGSNYAGYLTGYTYDMTGKNLIAKIAGTPNSATNAQMIFKFQKDTSNVLTFTLQGTTLKFQKNVAGAGYVDVASVTYNATNHKYWRIREASGTIYWDTAPDGVTWTNQATLATPFVITACAIELSAGTYQSETSPGTAKFEEMELYATAGGTQHFFSKASGTIPGDFLVLSDSNATGGAAWYAGDTSYDITNNDGWIFTAAAYDLVLDLAGDAAFSGAGVPDFYPTIDFAGDAIFVGLGELIVEINDIDRKTYMYKVYDSADNFIGLWNDVVSDPVFAREINTAGSSIEVELARNSDTLEVQYDNLLSEADDTIITEDSRGVLANTTASNQIGVGTGLELNYRVDIYVFYGKTATRITESGDTRITESGDTMLVDDGAVNGRLLFTGYVSRYVSRYGQKDNTLATLFSFGAELDNYMIESGGDTTLPYYSEDPGNILKSILDIHQANGGVVGYGTNSIKLTGTTVTYTFNTNTTLEGLKKSVELAPSGWSYYLDMALNEIHFFGTPTTVDHTFILGVHISELNLERNIENLVNTVYFTGGDTGGGENLFRKYTDSASITEWRPGLKKLSDNRVTLSDSADILSQAELDRGSQPRYRSTITILAETYSIEDIELGHLIGFSNFGNAIDSLTMQVVRIDYTPNMVTLQLDTLLPRVSKRLEDIKRNLDLIDQQNNPTAPTAG